MKYAFTIVAFVIFFLNACKKPTTQPQRPSKLITKISTSATDSRSFTYDDNKRLANHTLQFVNGDGTSFMSVNYAYIDGIINTAWAPTGSVFYETEGNQVKVVRSFRPMGSEISVINYSYNSKGQLIEWREKFSQPEVDHPKESKQTFEYYVDGNVKRVMYYIKMTNDGPFVLSGSTVYDQYDQFKNPEISCSGLVYLPSVIFHKNNAGRMRQYTGSGQVYQTSTFEYTYDAEGYPATKLYKDDRSTIPVLYTYSYQ